MRVVALLLLLAGFGAAAFVPLYDRPDTAGARRRAAAARAIGIADLCLSSDARWLRHPSLSEPAAAFHDQAAGPDAYPAGMVVAPPTPGYVDAVDGWSVRRGRPGRGEGGR